MKYARTWVLGAVVCTALGGQAAAAPVGKGADKASQVLKLNREALDLYELLEFDLARKSLAEAIEVGEAAGMAEHAVMARTHANLAVVYAVGLKDEAKAVEHFKRALAIRPDYKLPKDQATPDAQRLLARAQKELREPPPAPKVKDEDLTALLESGPSGRPKEGDGALRCPRAGEVQAGDDITLKCVTASELRPATVVLYYKRSGRDEFIPVTMKGDGDDRRWVARIPGDQVTGKLMPFYFEARDGRGEALALAGRNDSPNIITIRGGSDEAGETTAVSSGDEEEENPLVEAQRRRGAPAAVKNRFFIGLGVGSGGGYAKGDGVEAYHEYVRGFTPGLAMAGLAHAVPEIGYFVTPTFAVSLQGRNQYIPRETKYTAAGAQSVLARGLFFAGEGPLRFYGAAALGGGEGFRLVVNAATTDNRTIKDTVRGGPIVAGGGGGLWYALGDTFGWMLETNVLAGLPTFSAVVDVNTGLRAGF